MKRPRDIIRLRATTVQTLAAIIEDQLDPITACNPNLPPSLSAIVGRCLAKDARERFESTQELAHDLKQLSEIGTARAPQRSGIDSLVVLPLTNLSGDATQEYFADGLTEALITSLAKISTLRVISRTTAMHYKGTSKPLPEVARELNVQAVVEGSVLRAGGRVRISADLVEAKTDRHLWAESYERDLKDVLALQNEMARAIADEIRLKLTPEEKSLLAATSSVPPDAQEAYLHGRADLHRWSAPALRRAVVSFRDAVRLAPGFGLAHASLGYAYLLSAYLGFMPPRGMFERARASARQVRTAE